MDRSGRLKHVLVFLGDLAILRGPSEPSLVEVEHALVDMDPIDLLPSPPEPPVNLVQLSKVQPRSLAAIGVAIELAKLCKFLPASGPYRDTRLV